jgi:hypothetical protein
LEKVQFRIFSQAGLARLIEIGIFQPSSLAANNAERRKAL